MKAYLLNNNPITIKFIIESEQEFNDLYSRMNVGPDSIDDPGDGSIFYTDDYSCGALFDIFYDLAQGKE